MHASRMIIFMSLSALVARGSARALPLREDLMAEQLEIHTAHYDGAGTDAVVAYHDLIQYDDAPWIQLNFGQCHLGDASNVVLTVVATGEMQTLDAAGMALWRNTTARFRGDSVDVALYVAPGDRDVFITIESLRAPDLSLWPDPVEGGVASICGASDNRVASNDSRVGRINGCTAWLVSTGVVLTAGHCRNSAGNLTGSMEFNVPPSQSNGIPMPAALADTYPIINNSWTWEENGIGEDWLVFRIGPAADGSGKVAHIAQGFFHMTTSVPYADDTMRVTGYGLDNIPSGSGSSGAPCCDSDNDDACEYNCNSTSQTLQTSTGRFDELSDDTLEYEVDTMPANSGSPVIRSSTGFAVGIHTAGGCDSFWDGYENHGTWFGHAPLNSALNSYLGTNAGFVDAANVTVLELGTALQPFKSVGIAAALAGSGTNLLIAAGNYRAASGNVFTAGTGHKALTLRSNTGLVTIGN